MIVVCWRRPTAGNEEAWAKNVLTCEGPDLNPHPSNHSQGGSRVRTDEQDVPGHSKEVHKREQSQEALADDEFPAQSFRAVPHDVAIDLGHPERKVQKAHEPRIYGPYQIWPHDRPQGQNKQAK